MNTDASTSAGDDAVTTLRDHAWDYFELHADQRLKAFHFYILLETGLVAALLFAARGGSPDVRIVAVVGALMVFFSFIFWKLDQRTKGMIKVSERALKLFERRKFDNLSDGEIASSAPFTNDPQNKGSVSASRFGVLSYSKCFGAVFIAFAAVGLAIAVLALFSPKLSCAIALQSMVEVSPDTNMLVHFSGLDQNDWQGLSRLFASSRLTLRF